MDELTVGGFAGAMIVGAIWILCAHLHVNADECAYAKLIPAPLTNDQIISETQKCEKAGLRAYANNNNGFSSDVLSITCLPK